MENEDTKRLIPINLSCDEFDNWELSIQNGDSKKFTFKADNDKIRRMLRRMKAKDSMTLPNSKKGVVYQAMIDDAKSKESSQVYAWKSKLPSSLEDIKSLMEE